MAATMVSGIGAFAVNGFVILRDVVPKGVLEAVEASCDKELKHLIGSRNLLQKKWVRSLADFLQQQKQISELVGNSRIPVQCTYFSKTKSRNWLVPMHRDTKIPVKRRIDLSGWNNWSAKEGQLYVEPPDKLIRQLVAVRINLEANTSENGALQVIPGSHSINQSSGDRYLCEVPRGGALVMSPLLLHASSKIMTGRRRVLHFLYGPPQLPDGIEWASFNRYQT